jgi:1-acyl-sn-glycerol-3-phosphate acyltransferase
MRRFLGNLYLRFFGWSVDMPSNMPAQFVYIAFPHTSNWDMPHMVAITWATGVRVQFLMKHTLFKGPLDSFFRWLGALPVDRRSPQGLVGQAVEMFRTHPGLRLGIPPEGTRKQVEYWKSGFYRIACQAQVPIGLGYLDYARKVGGYGGFFLPTGDPNADMDHIRAFYAPIHGKHPELQNPPRLREEDEKPA